MSDDLIRALRRATRNESDIEQIIRRMIFNVVACNRDDHAKQHSLLFRPQTGWRLSPAYDLTFSNGPGGEHYLAINGKGRDIALKDVEAVAKRQGIRNASQIIDEVITSVAGLSRNAKAFGVSTDTMKQINSSIALRLAAFR